MTRPFFLEVADWKRSCRRRFLIGFGIGAVLAANTIFVAQHYAEVTATVDRRMEKACGYPRYPGEALMIGIDEKGITRCWKGPVK